MNNSFWDTVKGQQLADVLIVTLPKLVKEKSVKKTKQYIKQYKNYNRVRYFLPEFFNYSDFIFFTQNKNHSLLYDTIPYGSDLIQRTIYAKSYLITIVFMI